MNSDDNKVIDVTSPEQLAEYAKGQLVELPPFAEGQKFVARLKRPSILALAASGVIPNKLMQSANSLFLKGKANASDLKALPEMLGVLEIICKACFVNPTYDQIKEAGVTLTDDQLMFVFSYSQKGVAALENFRKQSANNINTGVVAAVQSEAV